VARADEGLSIVIIAAVDTLVHEEIESGFAKAKMFSFFIQKG
jgi:hypothetical protein